MPHGPLRGWDSPRPRPSDADKPRSGPREPEGCVRAPPGRPSSPRLLLTRQPQSPSSCEKHRPQGLGLASCLLQLPQLGGSGPHAAHSPDQQQAHTFPGTAGPETDWARWCGLTGCREGQLPAPSDVSGSAHQRVSPSEPSSFPLLFCFQG